MIKKFKTKPLFIKCPKVNRCVIKLVFFTKKKEEDSVNSLIATRILSSYNNNYRSITSFNTKKEELSIMNFRINKTSYNDFETITFSITIPKKGIIDDFSYDDVFKFLSDILYNPFTNKEGNAFNKKVFDVEKKYLLMKERDYPRSLKEYAFNEFLDFCDTNREVYGHYDQYVKYLKKANNVDVFEYYKKNIVNNSFITYIYGNIDNKEEIEKAFLKYFHQDKEEIVFKTVYNNYLGLKEYIEKNVDTKYSQSVLKLCYQVKDMRKKDSFLLKTLFYFLYSRENDLVYSNLRNENNLIYTLDMIRSDIYGVVVMTIFCTSNDIERVISVTNKSIEQIRNKDNFEVYKKRLLRALSYDNLSESDNPMRRALDKIDSDIADSSSFKTKINNINKISYDDMSKFLDRFILTRKMIFKGTNSN